MKRAVHLLNTLKPGGGENVAFNYAKVLKELNIHSVLVGKKVSHNYENMIAEEVNVAHKIVPSLLKNADYIFVHSNKNLLTLLFFRLLPLNWGTKRILYIQHLFFTKRKFRILSILINFLCTDFIRITVITQPFVNRYIKVKTHFLVNFYLQKNSPNKYPEIRERIRKELLIPDTQIVIMFSAVFKPEKGLKEFLKLASKFSSHKEYSFLIIGDGEERNLVKEYKGGNIIWTGFVTDVEQYLIASDIYCFTSLFPQEMLPMALVEAINCDMKILAFNTRINNFLLDDQTYPDVDSFYKSIISSKIPQNFFHYDGKYAKACFRNILQ